MEPTLKPGQVILINRLSYGLYLPFLKRYIAFWRQPEKGDILVLFHPEESTLVVKRCVAGEGDMIEHTIARLFSINTTIPDGYLFVLGDNRPNSIDSREYGLIPMSSVYGRVVGQ